MTVEQWEEFRNRYRNKPRTKPIRQKGDNFTNGRKEEINKANKLLSSSK